MNSVVLDMMDIYSIMIIVMIIKLNNINEKIVRIKRIQLEEDPGKIVYENNNSKLTNYCLIDYNRAGVALG